MSIREFLKRDHGIEVRISAGTGSGDDPYLVENCGADEAALTLVQLLRGIARGLGELWRIIEWKPCDVGSATEVIRVEALRFTPTQIETTIRNFYFDTRVVTGTPYSLHPLISWRPRWPGKHRVIAAARIDVDHHQDAGRDDHAHHRGACLLLPPSF